LTRLSSALNSSDLTHYESDCDSDLIRAAGLTSIKKTLGVLIVEATEGATGDCPHSAARVRDLQNALHSRVQRWARRCNIKVNRAGVAALIVRELILDRCPHCQGRGHIPMRYDGQRLVVVGIETVDPTVDADCPVCLGSGKAKRNYHARAKAAGLEDYDRRLDDFWKYALDACAEAEASARADMWRRLRRNS